MTHNLYLNDKLEYSKILKNTLQNKMEFYFIQKSHIYTCDNPYIKIYKL